MKYTLPFVLVLFCCLSCVKDGDVDMKLDEWTSLTEEDGLVSNVVTTMYTDSTGITWIGTTNGLSRFDGTTFTNYTVAGAQLIGDWILCVLRDRDGNMFVGTTKGLSFFDGTTWYVITLFNNVEVTSLVEASNGDIWVGTRSFGVIQLFYAGGYEQHLDDECDECNFIESLFRNDDGKLWIGSQADLKIYDGAFTSFTTDDGIASPWVSSMTRDHWGNVWLGSFAELELTRFSTAGFEKIPLTRFNSFNWIRGMVEDKNGLLWLAADQSGLLYYDGLVMRQVLGVFDESWVTSITLRKDGELWIGTEGEGIYKHYPARK